MHKFQLFERPIVLNNIDWKKKNLPKYYQPFPPKKIVHENQVDEETMKLYL